MYSRAVTMRSLSNIFGKPVWLYTFLAALVLLVVGLVIFKMIKPADKTEGFFPVNDARKTLGDQAMHRYNDFADTQDMERVNVIPEGAEGDPILNRLLDTPSYEPNGSPAAAKLNTASLNYFDERKNVAAPDLPILLKRIKMCEAVQSWECEALSRPDFKQYCGICTADGQDHLGKPHIGGLYTDPKKREQDLATATAQGKKPQYAPNFGRCKGEFITERPYCDVQKDRWHCSIGTSLAEQTTASKCAQCAAGAGTTFVYVGSRGNEDTNYKLYGNLVVHKLRLRLGVTHPDSVSITLTHVKTGTVLPGGFIPNTNVYLIDIPNGVENDDYNLLVRYPEFKNYKFTPEQNARILEITKPKRAGLVRATYGPLTDDMMKDDPRAVDVAGYIKDKFKVLDCSKTVVTATNDGLGGDPNPGIYKQLRLAYSDNGSDFAYAYGREGGQTQAVMTDTFKQLCPADVPLADAEREACEMNAGGTAPTGRIYTTRQGEYFGAGTTSKCIESADKPNRGIVGMWESVGAANRKVPLDLTVKQINNLALNPLDGTPKYGTVNGSEYFKGMAPLSRMPGIPPFLFWFWTKKVDDYKCEILCSIPATMRDPTIAEDNRLCPAGPLVATQEAANRLQSGMCDKLVNGQPQGPGTYTDDCIRSMFTQAGCTREGTDYPITEQLLGPLRTDPVSGSFNDADAIIAKVNETLVIARTGATVDGLDVEQDTYAEANMKCFGKFVTNVCETPFKETGPHTPACLDYLFRDAGKDNPSIGATYPNMENRSSGTNRVRSTPIMFCQRTGSKAPINADGKQNVAAIQEANSKGSVAKVRQYYRQIHYDANFNMDRAEQKEALAQCYGAKVVDEVKPCPPIPVKPPAVCQMSKLPVTPNLAARAKIGSRLDCSTGDYELKFDITPRGTVGGWGSIIHFTNDDNNCCSLGQRSPAIWLFPGGLRLHIRIGDAQDGNWGYDMDGLQINKLSKFRLTCKGPDIEIQIDQAIVKLKQPSRRYKGLLNAWAADPWHDVPNAKIDNLSYCAIAPPAGDATMAGPKAPKSWDEKTLKCIKAVEVHGFIPKVTWAQTPDQDRKAECDDLLCPWFKDKWDSYDKVPSKYAQEIGYCKARFP